MIESNMRFGESIEAYLYKKISDEILGRRISSNKPKIKNELKEKGIIDSSKDINKFILNHKSVFGNKKLIKNNFFSRIIETAPFANNDNYENILINRMKYEFNLSNEEIEKIDEENFFEDLKILKQSGDFENDIKEIKKYKNSIEHSWNENEQNIKERIYSILGYEPNEDGKVKIYIMSPKTTIHKVYPLSRDKSILFFAKRGLHDKNKILASLAHQYIHQPVLPYKPTMTGEEKEKFHAFIKFLSDKEIYGMLSEKSALSNITQNENPEVMGKVYPYWLAYKYRNVDKKGKDPIKEISKNIKEDSEYVNGLSNKSMKKQYYKNYNFEKLDPKKLSMIFREKRTITPYEFAKLDFDNKKEVYKNEYLVNRNHSIHER